MLFFALSMEGSFQGQDEEKKRLATCYLTHFFSRLTEQTAPVLIKKPGKDSEKKKCRQTEKSKKSDDVGHRGQKN